MFPTIDVTLPPFTTILLVFTQRHETTNSSSVKTYFSVACQWLLLPAVPKRAIKTSAARVAMSRTTGHEKCIIPGCTVSSSSLQSPPKEKNAARRWMNLFFGDLPQPLSWGIKWEWERRCLSLHCQSELLLIISGRSLCCMQLINYSASYYSVSFISHSPLIRPSAKSCSSRSATAGTTSATPSWPCRETARLSGARTRIQPVPPPPPTLWWFWNWWWVTAGGCRRRCWPSWLQRRAGTEGWVWMRFFIFREAN